MAKEKIEAASEESAVISLDSESLRDKIYEIRGQKVMLDYDLAKIYGYTTKAFNQQVKNNIGKFEGEDFMFRLTWEELKDSSRSKKLTLNKLSNKSFWLEEKQNNNRGNNYKYLPYAFTEQGIYMLMTVLKGELAVRQSRTLIRLFKTMKDYILESRVLSDYREQLRIVAEVMKNTKQMAELRGEMVEMEGEILRIDNRLNTVEETTKNTVMRSEISPILLDFKKVAEMKEFLFLDGEPMRADEMYIDLYSKAKKSIYIIDDYVSIKTLRHLRKVKNGVEIIVFSDNKGRYLHMSDYLDFRKEYPGLAIRFVKTDGIVHDRFIIIDSGTKDEAIYHCGASIKDAGYKVTAVNKLEDKMVRNAMMKVVGRLRENGELGLR